VSQNQIQKMTTNGKIIILISLFFLISCDSKKPVITSIDPKIGRMGEVITLTGSNFGELRDEAYVTIAGIAPTNSSYHSWQDDKIVIRVPELGESGLVYVHANGKKSNGMLFSNSAIVPRPVEGEELGLQPRVTSVSPQSAAPGALIIISGNNFGSSRENSLQIASGVFFSWDYDSGAVNPYVVREPEFIEVSDIEAGYESWSAREIHVRLPDGAVSGNIVVRTPYGSSRPLFFDVSGRAGNKNFKDKRSYTVNYSVDIRVLEATRPNNLYLWIPKPINSPSQRNVTLISRSTEPFIDNHRGVSLFKLENLLSGANQSVSLSFRVEVYAVETAMRPLSVRQDTTSVSAMYTQSSDLIPCDNQLVMSMVNSVIGREQNLYARARLIYDWIIRNIKIDNELPSGAGIVTALEERQADVYTAALLFTTMARAARVPCIPIAGVLIDRQGHASRHYWNEFWINDFGWVPVDIVMGSGIVKTGSSSMQDDSIQDHFNYYFGNLDNTRIAFSRGELFLSQMENRGRLVSHTQSYSLQNIWEEASGGLESYSSFWGDITISGIYIN